MLPPTKKYSITYKTDTISFFNKFEFVQNVTNNQAIFGNKTNRESQCNSNKLFLLVKTWQKIKYTISE